jgi:hypothetical protein
MTHITIERAKLEQALAALEGVVKNCWRDIPSWRLDEIKERITTIKQALAAPVHPDSARIDWLTNNPLDALDIFGHVKGSDAVRWIRQEIDNAMLKKDGATHD